MISDITIIYILFASFAVLCGMLIIDHADLRNRIKVLEEKLKEK
jgi:hypothetical protein